MMQLEAFAAEMEQKRVQMISRLNADIFRDGIGGHVAPAPLSWSERLRRRLNRVRAYFVTLGKALRGRELWDHDEYDDY